MQNRNDIEHQTKETYGLSPILTVKEVADFLNLNVKTVYSAVENNDIPCRRIGKRVVFFRETLLKWLLDSREDCVSSINRRK